MNIFDFVKQSARMLKNLERWLDKAVEHAVAEARDPELLVSARLAPDQYDLRRQIQSACDAAKFAAAYLSATEPPVHPDTESTLAELRARIHACLGFLEGLRQTDFVGAGERRVSPGWAQGKWLRGDHYMAQLAIPNFYFHVTVAYEILRNAGVPIGKMDFLGPVPMNDPR